MYNKLEEQEYASMVQKYRSEYGGRNLRGFCLEHKVSYQKMLHCLRSESYRNTQQAEEEAVLEQGLHPLEVGLPAKAPVTETQKWKPARKRESCESTPDFLLDDISVSFGSGISLHIGTCSKTALISLLKEMESLSC